jgi:hypothetical protein
VAAFAADPAGLVDGEVQPMLAAPWAKDERRLDHLEIHAPLVADLVIQAGDWIGDPLFNYSPRHVRAQRLMFAFGRVASADQLACLRIDAFDGLMFFTPCQTFCTLRLRS